MSAYEGKAGAPTSMGVTEGQKFRLCTEIKICKKIDRRVTIAKLTIFLGVAFLVLADLHLEHTRDVHRDGWLRGCFLKAAERPPFCCVLFTR